MWTFRVVVAGLFAFVFVFSAVFVPFATMVTNRGYVVRGEDRHSSMTPIVGSIAGVIAIVVAPFATFGTRAIWLWSPLVAEVGVVLIVAAVWRLLRFDRP